MSRLLHFKTALLKASVVLVPSYLAAYLTDKMVWVVPTLAASSFFAATIGLTNSQYVQQTDNDDDDTDQQNAESSV